ncbi:MAG: hypothetical protein ABI591_20600 [Kofleriaceae bacterium]
MLASTSEGNPLTFVPTQTTPDIPPQAPQTPLVFRNSADLDGTYVWLGPSGAASWIDSQWDSTFGIDGSVIRVREHELLSEIGGTVGASHWTVRGGGRIWAEALIGTSILDHPVGVSVGPILELSDVAHPRVGGSVGLWGFVGVTPFARVGTVESLGTFAEIGVHIALPVFRR